MKALGNPPRGKLWIPAAILLGALTLLSLSCGNHPHHIYTWWKAPNWTPDGKIVFLEQYYEYGRKLGGFGDEYTISEVYLCLINRDGSGYTNLTPDPIARHPVSTAASEDKLLACVVTEEGRYQMLLFDYNGNLLKTLGQGAYADFSPDGKRIVYQKYEGDQPKGIWIMDLESGEEREIYPKEGFPAWSPDGERIAYSSGGYVYIVDTSGTLLEGPLLPNTKMPDWGPDSLNSIVVMCFNPLQPVILNLNDMTTDTLNFGCGDGPKWSPDGDWFISYDENGYFVIKRDGSYKLYLTPGG